MSDLSCYRCGLAHDLSAKFCSECGSNLKIPRIKFGTPEISKIFVLGIVIFAITFAFGWIVPNSPLRLKKPATPYEAISTSGDKEIEAFRKAAEAAPSDIVAQTALASALIGKINNAKSPPVQLIYEAIDVLGGILRVEPKNQNALLALADISFAQGAFDKSAEYYKRYIDLAPGDLDVRANYASSLMFINQFDNAIKELNGVLTENPKHFKAASYLAIVYSKSGKEKEAKKAQSLALELAPTDKDREKLKEFFAGKLTKEAHDSQENITPEKILTVDDLVRSNSVAGPKFVRSEIKSGLVRIYFKDFPMDKMPPFVKEKFLTWLGQGLKELNIRSAKEFVIIDEATGSEMVKGPIGG